MTPKDLTDREYALNILEVGLGWPGKGNVEMMMDCLRAIAKCKQLASPYQAFVYLNRAIKLAKDQGQEVNRFWFQEGEYMNVRPPKKTSEMEFYKAPSAEELAKIKADQQSFFASSEYKAFIEKMDGKRMSTASGEGK